MWLIAVACLYILGGVKSKRTRKPNLLPEPEPDTDTESEPEPESLRSPHPLLNYPLVSPYSDSASGLDGMNRK